MPAGVVAARRFARAALGSSRVRSRDGNYGFPAPVPVGGASIGTAALKIGSALFAAQRADDALRAEQEGIALDNRYREAQINELEQRHRGNVSVQLSDGRQVDLSPNEAANYDLRTHPPEKTAAPRALAHVSKGELPFIGEGDHDPAVITQAGADYRAANRLASSARVEREARMITSQLGHLDQIADTEAHATFDAKRRFIGPLAQRALQGEPNALRELGISAPDKNDPVAVRQWAGTVATARQKFEQRWLEHYRVQARARHATERSFLENKLRAGSGYRMDTATPSATGVVPNQGGGEDWRQQFINELDSDEE